MADLNVTDPIFAFAATQPAVPAIIEGERSIDYAALCRGVRAAAAAFRDAGWRPGEIIGVSHTGARALHLVVALGLARGGFAQIALPPEDSPVQLRARVARAGVRAVVADHEGAAALGVPVLAPAAAWLDGADATDAAVAGADHVWLIAETSGTTGTPKLIGLTHAMEDAHHRRNAPLLSLHSGERFLNLTGLHFTMGLKRALWVLRDGATHVFTPRGMTFEQLPAFIDAREVSYLNCVPLHLHHLLGAVGGAAPRFPRLRVLRSSSAPLPAPVLAEVRRRISPNVFVNYGVSETGAIFAATPAMLEAHPDTVGHPLGDVEVEIVDAADRPLPLGAGGLVRLRGSGICPAYLRGGAADAAQVFRQGWCYPGDAGVLDTDGLLYLKGRADEVMNFDGLMVGPTEIETVMLAYPGVTGACAFPLPAAGHLEVPAAAYTAAQSLAPEPLSTYCRERLGVRAPQVLFQIDALPRGGSGKPLRRALIPLALERLRTAKSA